MRKLFNYITLLTFALLCSCSHTESNQVVPTPEKGSVTFTVEATPYISASESSRAFTEDQIATIHDGEGMENLFFILVDPLGIVAHVREFSHESTTYDGEKFSDIKQFTFSIQDLDVGDYTAYVYANYAVSQYDSFKSVKVGENFTLADDVFQQLPDLSQPHVSSPDPMLLTAQQVVPVTVGNSSATIELKRTIARFEFQIYNATQYNLTVSNLEFRDINPATSYVLPKSAVLAQDAEVGTIKNTYRPMPAFPYRCELGVPDGTTKFVIPKNETMTVYECCLYESAGDANLYQFDIELSLDGELSVAVPTYGGYQELTESIIVNKVYMLKNGDYFLYDDGSGKLSLVHKDSITDDNYQKAEWIFSGTSSGYIQNAATGNKYYRGDTSADTTEGDYWTFSNRGSGVYRIYYSYYWWGNYYEDYLYRSGNSVYCNYTDDNIDWQLCVPNIEITNTPKPNTYSEDGLQISVLQKDASVLPMTQILRNQHVVVTANVEYQETSGVFKFYVNPWTERNNTHTFN